MSDTVEQLAAQLVARVRAIRSRFMLGIAGPPGSGKSTLAAELAAACSASVSTAVIPLDGFHYPNAMLNAFKLRDRKGSPESFDAHSFADLIHRLRACTRTITAPIYDRKTHEPIPRGITVTPKTRLVIVEGNYLLLEAAFWIEAYAMLDETWYLDTPLETCLTRVRARHITGGLIPAQADEKIAINDRPNAQLIAATAARADRIIRLG